MVDNPAGRTPQYFAWVGSGQCRSSSPSWEFSPAQVRAPTRTIGLVTYVLAVGLAVAGVVATAKLRRSSYQRSSKAETSIRTSADPMVRCATAS